MKGVLSVIAAAAVLVPVATTTASASERLTTYDINRFVENFDLALNNADPLVGRSFLVSKVKETARLSNSVQSAWANHNVYGVNSVYHQNHMYGNYYRYPHAYSPNFRPTSLQQEGKNGIIDNFLTKKRLIPGFKQETTITATRLPAEATSASVDVDLKEFGLQYAGYGYGYGINGYHHPVTQKLQHTNAKCKMFLEKEAGQVRLNRMVCNTISNLPL